MTLSNAIIPYHDQWALAFSTSKPKESRSARMANEILPQKPCGIGRGRGTLRGRVKVSGFGSRAIENLVRVGSFASLITSAAGRGGGHPTDWASLAIPISLAVGGLLVGVVGTYLAIEGCPRRPSCCRRNVLPIVFDVENQDLIGADDSE